MAGFKKVNLLELENSAQAKAITVWLMDGDLSDKAVAAINTAFAKATGAKVTVQVQEWDNINTKISTALAQDSTPDVLEIGNTDVPLFAANGALADLSDHKADLAAGQSWLPGLAGPATVDGKIYAAPLFAGNRAVIYRKSIWAKAGVTAPPTTYAELTADLDKVKAANASDKSFSAFYMPGKYWYAAMSFVYGAGGKIAEQQGGKWSGTLESSQAQQGLTQWQKLTGYSVGGATKDESDQDAIMAQGHTGAILGNGWEVGSVTDPKTGKPALAPVLGTFPLPSDSAGQYTPSFLGGSDLAVPAKAPNSGLGATWIKYFTDTASQTALAKFAIPNTTSLLTVYEAAGDANKSTGEAAKNTWFVPNTPNWANVESGNVLQNMLESIATGKSSVADAAKSADTQIASILNSTS